MGYKYLAIIPARAGSKRLPNKNILELNGKPLIEWTILAAKGANTINEVLVTTDSETVQQLAIKNNCQLVIRPNELATDIATSSDVVRHALNSVNVDDYTHLILLQPTSPLRTYQHINEAIQLQQQLNADAVISICQCEHHPYWSNELPSDKNMSNFIPQKYQNIRAQDLPSYYRLNGAIYICSIQKFLESGKFLLSDNCYAYEMETKDSVDIDGYVDFKLAEILISDGSNFDNRKSN